MVTKVNNTVLNGTSPQISAIDVGALTAGTCTVTTPPSGANDAVNKSSLEAAILAAVPIGVVLPFAGPEGSVTAGWLLCDGSSYAAATYPDLFALIGYTYGGAGANFNVPDLRGNAVGGLDNMGGSSRNLVTSANADALGGELGEEEHTLITDEMPSHEHAGSSATTDPDGEHHHTVVISTTDVASGAGATVLEASGSTDTSIEPDHTHGVNLSISPEGGDNPHNNMQPTMFMNYIIRAE